MTISELENEYDSRNLNQSDFFVLPMSDDSGYFIELTKVFASQEEAKDYAEHLEIVLG